MSTNCTCLAANSYIASLISSCQLSPIKLLHNPSYLESNIASLGLTKPSTQEESTNFILRAFNSLISYVTSSYGKYAAITNATKAGEQFLVKNYRGLNPENAKEIAKIITNKNASIKYLENIPMLFKLILYFLKTILINWKRPMLQNLIR